MFKKFFKIQYIRIMSHESKAFSPISWAIKIRDIEIIFVVLLVMHICKNCIRLNNAWRNWYSNFFDMPWGYFQLPRLSSHLSNVWSLLKSVFVLKLRKQSIFVSMGTEWLLKQVHLLGRIFDQKPIYLWKALNCVAVLYVWEWNGYAYKCLLQCTLAGDVHDCCVRELLGLGGIGDWSCLTVWIINFAESKTRKKN